MKFLISGLAALTFSSLAIGSTPNYSCDVFRYVKNGPTQKDTVITIFPDATSPTEVNVYGLSNTQSQLVFTKLIRWVSLLITES